MDFGLTELFWLPAGRPADGLTARYAAPELLDGQVSRTCDQYSLALIYQELLTGLSPFRHAARPQLAVDASRRKLDLALLPLSDRAIIQRALHPDPEERFASGTELVRALEEATTQKEPVTEPVITSLPAIITWPSSRVGPAHAPGHALPDLDRFLPQLVTEAGGGVQVQEFHGIRYLLQPGQSLHHRCAAWLPPGVAQIKLTGFAQQWGAEIVHCDDRSLACYVRLPGTLWQRCVGRDVGLEVQIRLRQPPAPVVKLTEVDVEMKPHGASKAQRVQLLWEVGPRLLESLRLHLHARPEQRQQARLICQHSLQVASVRRGLPLSTRVDCQSKDISPGGIGFFLPDQPSTPQIYLNLDSAPSAAGLGVLARIVRAQPCGDGWYEVGAAFPVQDNMER
jgi:hypothetical protein